MEYNCRLYSYPDGDQVTFYTKTITRKSKDNNKIKENRDKPQEPETKPEEKERTKEQEKHSMSSSLGRTKNAIYNIARSNTWEWFITLTFERTKTDASDYDLVVYRLKIFLNNLQKRKCPGIKYLIVPELHDDKENYHFHGLLADCEGLSFKFSGHYDNKSGDPFYNITNWTYGFTTATRVRDTRRASSYITKYITKESDLFLKGKNRYYCSRNTCRTEADFFMEYEEDFLKVYGQDITYTKTVTVSEAYQRVRYYELEN